MMKPVAIVGAGLCFSDLSHKYLDIIDNADILVGGRRHLSWFDDFPGEKKEIIAPLSEMVAYIRQWMDRKKIVVLASGDPLFFGIGERLVRELGEDKVRIYPNINTMAACFSHMKMPWNQATVVSLHGRDGLMELKRALYLDNPIFILTDPRHNPSWVAGVMIQEKQSHWSIWVFERLGETDERIRRFLPSELSLPDGPSFDEPNSLVLIKDIRLEKKYPLIMGAPESWYEHEQGLITKSEVRAITLSRLRLLPDHIFWDLGSGSGSVAIEAALFVTRGKIVAVEKSKSRAAQIRHNARNFGVGHIEIVEAELPEGMDRLPAPHRVFIGGGGKNIGKILEVVSNRLLPGGRVVINAVLIENMAFAMSILKKAGYATDVVQVQISEGHVMPVGTRFAAKNPVWIISGER